jgi:hypothetical protein
MEAMFQLSRMASSLMRGNDEDVLLHALRVFTRPAQPWGNGRDEDGSPDPGGTEPAVVAGHLTPSHRETHQGDLPQVELREDDFEVASRGVVVVALGGLTGLAKAPPIVADDPVLRGDQSGDLLLPGSAAQGPATDQYHGCTGAMVLIVKPQICRVFSTDGDEGHAHAFGSGVLLHNFGNTAPASNENSGMSGQQGRLFQDAC